MSADEPELGEVVLAHILELARSSCSITEADIAAAKDPTLSNILAGLMTLHEELCFREQERVAARRRSLELSTPVLDVGRQVLLLPVIGVLDVERSEQMLERTLHAVASQAARVLVIDITGLANIDAEVAARVLALVRAVKLLGARSILTGVSPANARILVELGTELGGMQTLSTLGAGLEAAFALTRA